MLMYHVQREIREIKIQGCIIGDHTHMYVSNLFLKVGYCVADSTLTTRVKAFALELLLILVSNFKFEWKYTAGENN